MQDLSKLNCILKAVAVASASDMLSRGNASVVQLDCQSTTQFPIVDIPFDLNLSFSSEMCRPSGNT